uniref:Uncharacterized protein n=1 Tax=Rhizophora mucronata TaxID=61149 RepID=A0A2P2PXI2_RHIMU
MRNFFSGDSPLGITLRIFGRGRGLFVSRKKRGCECQ